MGNRGLQEVVTREILGVPVAVVDYAAQLSRMAEMIATRERGYFCHAAVGSVMNATRDPAVASALSGATMTLPDGKPLIWALRALDEEIAQRVYGPDLMLMACERFVADGARHFLYGGHDAEATAALEESLRKRFPGIEIAGSFTPPFRDLSREERAGVIDRIDSRRSDVVWVGTGSPRQELWMAEIRPDLAAPVLVGVGAAFDFHAGRVAQAPRWMGDRGLEWLYRLTREPGRLGPRYLRDNPAFVAAFARQLLARRR